MLFEGKMRLAALAVVIGGAALSGCASLVPGETKFSCQGYYEGVECMSAREVYQRTEAAGPVTLDDGAQGGAQQSVNPSERRSGVEPRNGATGSHAGSNLPSVDGPVPIRTASRVMRVWVAPWEGESGDLNVTGLIYTEIEPRRWNIGVGYTPEAPRLTPLQMHQLGQ